ncbi:hypothetical protein JCM10914A_43050 [Paenibacillus sp. JCM 10914]|uniref:helix-turn-helix domain-containing protein n=1 Tax=Paenibacillus sp. JCM 10914 TaxID=1236974 RepID=UPI0003CC5AC3|nr:helix-turn-helix transcriptional regulator [Paenibacillus sp. JCM 10914]GAE05524.1 hypothetical protein JCM10914_1628 [Paenibacillus sp. JCM 10914]
MLRKVTIHEQLERYLLDHGMTINQFAQHSGLNSGTLSAIINGVRPISMHQLDQITMGMELPEGSYYEQYIDECIFHTKPDWRRLGAFIRRCAELDKLNCLQSAVQRAMDSLSYIPQLFDLAEVLYHDNQYAAARIIYQNIAESERFQHSERLALCQYRLFLSGLCDDEEVNLQKAIHFEMFVERLDEQYQFDALRHLININTSLHRWDKVEELANSLEKKAYHAYHTGPSTKKRPKYDRPLLFYLLFSKLVLADVFYKRNEYDRALYYVTLYEAPDWVIEPDEEELLIVDQFHEWAIANRFLYQMMSGQTDKVNDYIAYVADKTYEMLPALYHIMIAANRFQLQVDDILDKYHDYISDRQQRSRIGEISNQVSNERYARLWYELAQYYINSGRFDRGVKYILQSMEKSIHILSSTGILRCSRLFAQNQHSFDTESRNAFERLSEQAQRLKGQFAM